MQCLSRTGNVILSLIFLLLEVIQIIVFVNVRKHKLEGKRLMFTDKERQIRPPTKPEVNETRSFKRSPFQAAIPHV